MKQWNKNRYFKACADCVPPKRYPGCHARCEEYKDDKKAYEKVKESQKKENDVSALFTESFDRTCRYHGIKRREPMK